MNRRDLLKDAGIAAAASSLFVASSGRAEAQAVQASPVTVLIAYHSVTGNTEKMAQGVAEGCRGVAGTEVVLKKVHEVSTEDLLAANAVVVGSPVYFANMSGEVKMFFDHWLTKYGVFRELKMRNKIGAAFVTGASVSNGKETTMLAILEAMVMNQMVTIAAGGAFGASATTGPDSPGVDEKEMGAARDLGKRVAEVAAIMKRGVA
jgi:NAD(P)H dehydrogenase (quinone)